MKIVLASNNEGKIKEINNIVTGLNLEITSQAKLGIAETTEDGLTFIENAIKKARHASKESGLPALADDSGLVVTALQGEPGIYSARYAGKDANSEKNIAKLLASLKNVTQRQAYYYCILVLMRSAKDPCPIISEGRWQGEILLEPIGTSGFGYDPIFYDGDHQCSAAQLPSEIKNSISHRGKAMQQLLDRLRLDLPLPEG